MRARFRSYGETSTLTRSPGRMRMRKRRILPATWPRTSWPLSSCTRNMAFGRASTTSPSNSTFSSFAKPPALYQSPRSAPRGRSAGRRAAGAGALGVRRPLGRGLVLARVEAAVAVPGSRVGPRAAGGRRRGGGRGRRGGGRRRRGGDRRGRGRRARGLAHAAGLAADAVARVGPVERLRDERLLGQRERAAERAARLAHVGAPDLRRVGAAVEVRAVVEPVHRRAVVGIADPHRGGQLRREAD